MHQTVIRDLTYRLLPSVGGVFKSQPRMNSNCTERESLMKSENTNEVSGASILLAAAMGRCHVFRIRLRLK